MLLLALALIGLATTAPIRERGGPFALRNSCTLGQMYCNGPTQFAECGPSGLQWQMVAAGTVCQNGAIVLATSDMTASAAVPSASNSTMLVSTAQTVQGTVSPVKGTAPIGTGVSARPTTSPLATSNSTTRVGTAPVQGTAPVGTGVSARPSTSPSATLNSNLPVSSSVAHGLIGITRFTSVSVSTGESAPSTTAIFSPNFPAMTTSSSPSSTGDVPSSGASIASATEASSSAEAAATPGRPLVHPL